MTRLQDIDWTKIGQNEKESLDFMRGKTIERIEVWNDFFLIIHTTDGYSLQIVAPTRTVILTHPVKVNK